MPDPVTSNYSLALPTVGGDSNIWGGVQNNGIFSPLDNILGSIFGVAITVADVTLSATQFQNLGFLVSGALTGDRSLIIPLSPNSATVACGGRFTVSNITSGAHSLSVKTAAIGSTGVVVPQGFTAMCYSDGTNVGFASNGLPSFAAAVNGNPNGQLAGTAGSVNTNASLAFDYTNGVMYVCTTTGNAAGAVWTSPVSVVNRGFDTAVNLEISATHTGGNLLNIALKTGAGADPTPVSPLIVEFQTISGSNTAGAKTAINITAPLSMTTNATGATLGSVNGVAFRFWIALFNNAGTAVLAIMNASTATELYAASEYGTTSTLGISGSATLPGVWYTPNGIALASCAYRLIGYLEYTGGLTTAGTFTSDPTNVVIFGPGVQKPGDVVQSLFLPYTTPGSGTNTYPLSNTAPTTANTNPIVSQTFNPTSAVNLLRIEAQAVLSPNTSSNIVLMLQRDSNVNALAVAIGFIASNAQMLTLGLRYQTVLNSVAQTTVRIYAAADAGTINWNKSSALAALAGSLCNTYIQIDELMG